MSTVATATTNTNHSVASPTLSAELEADASNSFCHSRWCVTAPRKALRAGMILDSSMSTAASVCPALINGRISPAALQNTPDDRVISAKRLRPSSVLMLRSSSWLMRSASAFRRRISAIVLVRFSSVRISMACRVSSEARKMVVSSTAMRSVWGIRLSMTRFISMSTLRMLFQTIKASISVTRLMSPNASISLRDRVMVFDGIYGSPVGWGAGTPPLALAGGTPSPPSGSPSSSQTGAQAAIQ